MLSVLWFFHLSASCHSSILSSCSAQWFSSDNTSGFIHCFCFQSFVNLVRIMITDHDDWTIARSQWLERFQEYEPIATMVALRKGMASFTSLLRWSVLRLFTSSAESPIPARLDSWPTGCRVRGLIRYHYIEVPRAIPTKKW